MKSLLVTSIFLLLATPNLSANCNDLYENAIDRRTWIVSTTATTSTIGGLIYSENAAKHPKSGVVALATGIVALVATEQILHRANVLKILEQAKVGSGEALSKLVSEVQETNSSLTYDMVATLVDQSNQDFTLCTNGKGENEIFIEDRSDLRNFVLAKTRSRTPIVVEGLIMPLTQRVYETSPFRCETAYKKSMGFFKNVGKFLSSKEGTIFAAFGGGMGALSCIDTDSNEILCASASQSLERAAWGASGTWLVSGVVSAKITSHKLKRANAVLTQVLFDMKGIESQEFSASVRRAIPVSDLDIKNVLVSIDQYKDECALGHVLDYDQLLALTKQKLADR